MLIHAVELEPTTDGPIFLACTFSHNTGSGVGRGCVFTEQPIGLTLINCVAFDNSLNNASFVWAQNVTSLTMINCTVSDNLAINPTGSAVEFLDGEDCLISNCVLWDNSNGSGQSEKAQIEVEGATGDAYVRNCDIQGLDEFTGNYNFDADPLFVNAGSENFTLEYLSPALNNGDASDMPADDFDIDDDSDIYEAIPDRNMKDRQVNPSTCVDVGSWEEQTSGTCAADITDGSGGGPDGDVGDPDLDLVLDTWNGPGGVADLHPADCGNSVVNIDDLVFVVTHWGSCSSFGPQGPIDEGDAIEILLAFMAEHEEHTVLVLQSIEYITENGL